MADLLLVDNDRRIAELCGWFLERRGHRVRHAASYAEARARIRERAPELMLADLELGRESGREELPRLAQEGILPPTLVVSGFLDREVEAELRALRQVRGALAKPFDVNDLVQRVEDACGAPAREPVAAPAAEPASGLAALDPAGAESSSARDRSAATEDDAREDEDGWIEILPRGRGAP